MRIQWCLFNNGILWPFNSETGHRIRLPILIDCIFDYSGSPLLMTHLCSHGVECLRVKQKGKSQRSLRSSFDWTLVTYCQIICQRLGVGQPALWFLPQPLHVMASDKNLANSQKWDHEPPADLTGFNCLKRDIQQNLHPSVTEFLIAEVCPLQVLFNDGDIFQCVFNGETNFHWKFQSRETLSTFCHKIPIFKWQTLT